MRKIDLFVILGCLVVGVRVGTGYYYSATPGPAPAASAPSSSVRPSTVEVANDTATAAEVYVAFGSDSVVLPASIPICANERATALTCQFELRAHHSTDFPLAGRYFNATVSFNAPVGCGSTKAEINVNNPSWYDTLDVSLVDGFNAPVAITVRDEGDGGRESHTLGPVLRATGNERGFGVFPYGCDICVARQEPPCGIVPGGPGCKTGTQSNPDVVCQYKSTQKSGGSTVTVALLP